ncbi:hypothetical protein EDC04DRAFT_2686303, partial [Pisolithus marmoratus]
MYARILVGVVSLDLLCCMTYVPSAFFGTTVACTRGCIVYPMTSLQFSTSLESSYFYFSQKWKNPPLRTCASS